MTTSARPKRSSTAPSRTTGSRREALHRSTAPRRAGARPLELDRHDARALGPADRGVRRALRVLRYDQLGHGGSEVPPGPYTVERSPASCSRCSTSSGSSAFSYCGVSLGGMVGSGSARTPRSASTGSCWLDSAYFGAAGAVDGARRARPRGGARRGRRALDGALVHGRLRRLGALARRAARRPRRGIRRVLRRDRGWDLRRELARHHPRRRSSSPAPMTRRRRRPTPSRSRPASRARSSWSSRARAHLAQRRAARRIHRRRAGSSGAHERRRRRWRCGARCSATSTSTARSRARPSSPPTSRTSSRATPGARSGRARASTGGRAACITLTALVALGRDHELAMHVRAALRNGLTPDEIKEVLLQSASTAASRRRTRRSRSRSACSTRTGCDATQVASSAPGRPG